LTSLRFVAASYVVIFHYWPIFLAAYIYPPGFVMRGNAGVTFFFVLAGFILAYNYAETNFSERGRLVSFYIARLSRIYPVYLIALAISLPSFVETVRESQFTPFKLAASSGRSFFSPRIGGLGSGCGLRLELPWVVDLSGILFLSTVSVPHRAYSPEPYALARCYGRGLVDHHANRDDLVGCIWRRAIDLEASNDGVHSLVGQFVAFFPVNRVAEFVLGIVLFSLWQRHPLLRYGRLLPLGGFAIGAALLVLARKSIPEVVLQNGLTAVAWAPLIVAGANTRSGF
jgi:peptidoglycan/LPS O-acetylase OafA/YrhL